MELTNQETTEIQMIVATRKDPREFGGLYRKYVELVFRYLYSRLENVSDAEDVTAQTFLTAFESFDKLRNDGHFAAWLFSIARNKCIDHYRNQPKTSLLLEDSNEFAVETDPLIEVVNSEQSTALRKLIKALPDEDRELLQLRFLAKLSFPEMASLLNRNEDAVKKSLYRLLDRLHTQMEVSND